MHPGFQLTSQRHIVCAQDASIPSPCRRTGPWSAFQSIAKSQCDGCCVNQVSHTGRRKSATKSTRWLWRPLRWAALASSEDSGGRDFLFLWMKYYFCSSKPLGPFDKWGNTNVILDTEFTCSAPISALPSRRLAMYIQQANYSFCGSVML